MPIPHTTKYLQLMILTTLAKCKKLSLLPIQAMQSSKYGELKAEEAEAMEIGWVTVVKVDTLKENLQHHQDSISMLWLEVKDTMLY